MKKKIFKFDTEDDSLNPISSMKKHVPQWYKNIKVHSINKMTVIDDIHIKKNVKNCLPFLDSLTTGYCIELWSDVLFTKKEDDENHTFMWHQGPDVCATRNSGEESIPIPLGHSGVEYVWINPYAIELPPGYSAIFTHPFNRTDLPFTTLTGIIDADYPLNGGNVPFYIKDNFSGVIEQGTPIVQIIPFKREDWKIQKEEGLFEKALENHHRSLRAFFGWNKQKIWKRKNFN